MKSLKKIFVLAFALVLIIPFSAVVNAEEEKDEEEAKVTAALDDKYYASYNTLNLTEALKEEEIENINEDYEENDKQITVYLFRGKGCSHCREFLTFLNSISEEYGKYFRVVAFEVWNDSANNELMKQVAEKLGQEAGGVPFIVIGDKTFGGYASSYDDQIKDAIKSLYEQSKDKRYDVLAKLNEKPDTTVSNIIVGTVTVLIIGGIVATKIVNKKNEE